MANALKRFAPKTYIESIDDHKITLSDVERAQLIEFANRVPTLPEDSATDVVQLFHGVFELVGGVPRMALWADANYTDFMRLYAKLLPTKVTGGDGGAVRIEHVLPGSALDAVTIDQHGMVIDAEQVDAVDFDDGDDE